MVHQVEHLFDQEKVLVSITACEKSNAPRGQRRVTTEQKLSEMLFLGVLNIWILKKKKRKKERKTKQDIVDRNRHLLAPPSVKVSK